jgi:hypothetical protein
MRTVGRVAVIGLADRLRADLETVADDLRATVRMSIRPTLVAVWLRETGR